MYAIRSYYAFGGVNYMEFYADDKVIVNPLRIKSKVLNELAHNLVLYYTGTSRVSAKIIEAQQQNVKTKKTKSVEAMHNIKKQATTMKEALLREELDNIGKILDFGWQQKNRITSYNVCYTKLLRFF